MTTDTKCERCGKYKGPQHFMPTHSKLWQKPHINLCYDCIPQLVNGDNLNEVDRLMQFANIAFFPEEWRKIWRREGASAYKQYAAAYFENNYLKYDWSAQNEKLKQLAKSGLIETTMMELEPSMVKELKLKWGNLPDHQVMNLEKFYNAAMGDYNVQTEIQRDTLRKLARISLLIDVDLLNGITDKDKITNFTNLQKELLKNLETTEGDSINTLAQIVTYLERNGFKPKFYDGLPKDEYDMMIENMKEYTADLVATEANLGELYLAALQEVEKDED